MRFVAKCVTGKRQGCSSKNKIKITTKCASVIVFLAIFILPPQAFSLNTQQVRAEVSRIKAQKYLLGSDRIQATYNYVRSLSDVQLAKLLNHLGVEPFLENLPLVDSKSIPLRDVRSERKAKSGYQDNRESRDAIPLSQQQLERVLESPRARDHLVRRVANHLYNSVNIR